MKIRLYGEEIPVKEKEITLRLFRDCGEVVVGVVDDEGKVVTCGVLIEFHSDMTFKRVPCVNTELGLPLGERDRLIEGADD